MAQTGFTPLQLYSSTTPAAQPVAGNLLNGELAINITDKKLYAKDNLGNVFLLASATGAAATVQSVSVVSANGLAGTVATATTTPAITLSTTVTGLLKGNGTGISAATANTDYLTPPSGTALLKANSGGALANAVAGTDYAPATSGSSILYGNGAGGFSNVTIGSGISFSAGTLSATGTGGTVTSASVVSANGFAGTVATATTTPAITLTTTVTGLLKGNGTALSAAVSGTDYAPATSGSAILYGNGAGGFSNVTIGSGISFSAGTLSATGSGGTVTSVSFTGGIVSVATATTTPALTVAGTSGGVPYFSSASTWATSAALAANAIVLGGGAGAAPATTTTGTGVVTALGNNINTAAGFITGTGTATLNNKRIDPRVSSTTSASSVTPDISAFDQYAFTAQAATLTINAPIGTPADGDKLIFRILDNGTPQTLSWNGTYTVIGVTLPTTTTANKMVYVGCIYNAANTRWDVVAVTTQA